MKHFKCCILFTLVFIANNIMAQSTVTGLYLTLDDYNSHKLSYTTTGNDGSSISLHSMFVSSKITVVLKGEKKTLIKNQVFGFHSDNQDFRFFNNRSYHIITTKDFCIYSYSTLAFAGKGMKPTQLYYFSNTLNNTVEPLTLANVETVYAKNIKFKYMVEQQFKTDEQLAAYDPTIKQFKINFLYDESTK